ncbi:anti-sigma factor [Propionivibrio sp.]|uniref:anti-sigma factor n=1 Tax=Propionivibrio sp. TaxID=2212460 RepID=UPI00260E4913|nr:anti-sigma factor [Propionivibrio sp.]MBK8402447.1 anti-sigma factor [Propionivibrio sp.]
MNYDRPALLDGLASAYVLGTLQGPARHRFERLLPELVNARLAVAAWESRLHALAQSVPQAAPSPQVWKRIESRIAPRLRTQESARRAWWSKWIQPMAGVLTGMAIGVLAVKLLPNVLFPVDQLAQQEKALSQSYVGLLLDRDGKPTVLATATRHGTRLKLKILRSIAVPATGKVLALWALPHDPAGHDLPPLYLGRIPAEGKGELMLSDGAEKLLSNVSRLGVSLESAESSSDHPSTFVLTGHCVRLW